jgi:hypothetical protein
MASPPKVPKSVMLYSNLACAEVANIKPAVNKAKVAIGLNLIIVFCLAYILQSDIHKKTASMFAALIYVFIKVAQRKEGGSIVTCSRC